MQITTKRRTNRGSLIPEGQRASELFGVQAYSDPFFLIDDSAIGFGFVCTPLNGLPGAVQEAVTNMLNSDWPTGSVMQFILHKSPDIEETLAQHFMLRKPGIDAALKDMQLATEEFFRHHAQSAITSKGSGANVNLGLISTTELLVTMKVPHKGGDLTETKLRELENVRNQLQASLAQINLAPTKLTAEKWVRRMQTMLSMDSDASWRTNLPVIDQHRTLAEQVLDYNQDLTLEKDYIKIGESTFISCLSAKAAPSECFMGDAMSFDGAINGGTPIDTNYFVSACVHFPDAESKRQEIARKRTVAVNQDGPMARFVPELTARRQNFDIMQESIDGGARPVELSYSLMIIAKSDKELAQQVQKARAHWSQIRWNLVVDRFVQMPVLLNSLPLTCEFSTIKDLARYRTNTAEQAAVQLPLFASFKGTGTPAMLFVTRTGQLATWSLTDSASNMNAVVAATSGGGKSFLMNANISTLLQLGGRVWIIDRGRSYENLVETLGGNFIVFDQKGRENIQLNPFAVAFSLDGSAETLDPEFHGNAKATEHDSGSEDILINLLTAMAFPVGTPTDYQLAAMRDHLRRVWMVHFRKTTVDLIVDSLNSDEDDRARDIARQLEPFTSRGAFGGYFNKGNNLNDKFSTGLVCLELEELSSSEHLSQVVLLSVLASINQAMFLGDRGQHKTVLLDECWALLGGRGNSQSNAVAEFIERCWRTARKANGSMVAITQSVADLHSSSSGKAIADNSATQMLLKQNPSTLQLLKSEGKITLPPAEFKMLESVHTMPGAYSEIFIDSQHGRGVVRFIASEYQKLLFSTKGEDVQAIRDKKAQGMNVGEAVRAVMADRGIKAFNDKQEL